MKIPDMKGHKVFITGADGFIGSHLTEALVRAGAHVKALVCYNSWNSFGRLEELDKEIEPVFGDVRDSEFILSETRGMSMIFHLASLISIPYSYKASRSYVKTNIDGAVNVCQAVMANGIGRLIHTSTSEVYGTARYVPIDEKHPLQPQSPYSASKISADMMALSYHYSFDLPLVLVRPFNTFGPRQTPRAVIPSVISQCLRNRDSLSPLRMGSLEPRRDFNYVKDVVRAFILAALSEKTPGKSLNVATGHDISIGDMLHEVMEILGVNLPVLQEDQRIRPAASEVMGLRGDAGLIRDLCGWEPQYTFRQGLEETIDWIEAHLDRINTDIYWT